MDWEYVEAPVSYNMYIYRALVPEENPSGYLYLTQRADHITSMFVPFGRDVVDAGENLMFNSKQENTNTDIFTTNVIDLMALAAKKKTVDA